MSNTNNNLKNILDSIKNAHNAITLMMQVLDQQTIDKHKLEECLSIDYLQQAQFTLKKFFLLNIIKATKAKDKKAVNQLVNESITICGNFNISNRDYRHELENLEIEKNLAFAEFSAYEFINGQYKVSSRDKLFNIYEYLIRANKCTLENIDLFNHLALSAIGLTPEVIKTEVKRKVTPFVLKYIKDIANAYEKHGKIDNCYLACLKNITKEPDYPFNLDELLDNIVTENYSNELEEQFNCVKALLK